MKNARPRFALLDDGRLHDYGTDRTINATGNLETPDGVWDLAKVRQLIEDEETIESAFTPRDALDNQAELHRVRKKLKWANDQLKAAPPAPPVDKVVQADKDFAGTIDGNAQV